MDESAAAVVCCLAICLSLFVYLLLLMLGRFAQVILKNRLRRLLLLMPVSGIQFNLASVVLPQIELLFAFSIRVIGLSRRVVVVTLQEKEVLGALSVDLFKLFLKFPCW